MRAWIARCHNNGRVWYWMRAWIALERGFAERKSSCPWSNAVFQSSSHEVGNLSCHSDTLMITETLLPVCRLTELPFRISCVIPWHMTLSSSERHSSMRERCRGLLRVSSEQTLWPIDLLSALTLWKTHFARKDGFAPHLITCCYIVSILLWTWIFKGQLGLWAVL